MGVRALWAAAMNTVQYATCNGQCAMDTVQWTQCNGHCAMDTVQCASGNQQMAPPPTLHLFPVDTCNTLAQHKLGTH